MGWKPEIRPIVPFRAPGARNGGPGIRGFFFIIVFGHGFPSDLLGSGGGVPPGEPGISRSFRGKYLKRGKKVKRPEEKRLRDKEIGF
jgi:hypothetical protein